ncbi:MAG: type II toxin-antitoxin system HicA family toxin [Armatimonadetes bacterium]|nr:type II toxin-antitoxin system HicA family toxin [Anaerolineae bacterium]
MSKRKKRLERIRQNPKNVSFEELRQVLEDYDFTLERISGSHYIFKHKQLVTTFALPYRKSKTLAVYAKFALVLIDKVIALQSQKSEEETDDDDE